MKNEITSDRANLFAPAVSIITPEHIKNCDCMKSRLIETFKRLLADDELEIKTKNIFLDTPSAAHRKRMIYEKAINEVSKYAIDNNILCPIERQFIDNELKFFREKYDLSDPRVYVVLSSTIDMGLSALRMSNYTKKHSVMYETMNANGELNIRVNPVEELKLKFHQARIKAISDLNNILYGQKITHTHIDLNKLIEARDIFGKLDESRLIDL